jgi:Transaldolase/Fructose-6-phosphate aldolase
MMRNSEHDPLGDLSEAGVAVWLDDLSRELLAGGGLQSLVATFADHGQVAGDTVTGGYAASRHVMDQLAAVGIDFDDVTRCLERDGLAKFEKSWGELGATVAAELQQQRTTSG